MGLGSWNRIRGSCSRISLILIKGSIIIMASLLIEAVGWIGALLIVIGYFLITHGRLNARDKEYHLINLSGSILLGINAYINNALPSFGINIVFISIALYGLYIVFKK